MNISKKQLLSGTILLVSSLLVYTALTPTFMLLSGFFPVYFIILATIYIGYRIVKYLFI